MKSGTAKREIDFKGGITASNPFRPLPIDFKGPYLALRLRFYYNPDPSLLAPNRAICRKHRPSRQCWLWLELVSVCTLL